MYSYKYVRTLFCFFASKCTQDYQQVSMYTKVKALLLVFFLNSYRNLFAVTAKFLLLLVLLVPFAVLILSSAIHWLTYTSVLPLSKFTYVQSVSSTNGLQPLTLLSYVDAMGVLNISDFSLILVQLLLMALFHLNEWKMCAQNSSHLTSNRRWTRVSPR